MVKTILLAAEGLSGKNVRGVADNIAPPDAVQSVAQANSHELEATIRHAADLIREGLNLTGRAMEQAVDAASSAAFQNAAQTGANIASPGAITQGTFSWSGYIQAMGILCLLLAALWFAVWLIRRYGKFNFLPRPGALPKEALVMEAQMPLGPRKGLMVVRFLNRRLLLGITEQRISLLTEERAQDERLEKSFGEYMAKAGNTGDYSSAGDRHSA